MDYTDDVAVQGYDPDFVAVDPGHVCCHVFRGSDCGIRSFSMCNVLQGPAIEQLEALSRRVTFEPRRQIIAQDAPITQVYNLTAGTVRLARLLTDGRRQVIGFLLPGDFIGLTQADVATYSADALTAVSACQFDRAQFTGFTARQPQLLRRLYTLVSRELELAQEQMSILGRRNAEEKIACFLMGLRKRLIRSRGRSDTIPLAMSRQDMADYLGLTIETVSRTLTRFDREGVLDVARDRVRICNKARIDELIAG